MARSVGGIVAKMYLEDKEFRRKIDQISKVVRKRAERMRKAFNTLATRGILVATAAIATFAVKVGKAIGEIDNLAKTADKLGATTEAIQLMRYAGEQTGVEMATLDMSLQRMVRRVSQAAKGTGAAAAALEDLGIDARELSRMSMDKQFEAIGEAMNGLSNQGDRVRVAMDIFGQQGAAMVNMLSLGKEGMEGYRQEMERFGVAVSRVDAAKVEQANDQFTRLNTLMKGFFQQMAIQLSPAIFHITEQLLDMSDAAGGMGNVADSSMKKIIKGVGYVSDAFWGLQLVYQGLSTGVAALQHHTAQVLGYLVDSVRLAINELIGGVNWLSTQANKILPEKLQIGMMDGLEWNVARDFLAGMADEFGDLADERYLKFAKTLDKDRPTERIERWFEQLADQHEKMSREGIKGRLNAEGLVIDSADELAAGLEGLKDATDEYRMSISDIAQSGATGSNVTLAQRAEELRRQERMAEAQGRFSAADRLGERAQELEDRVKRRTEGEASPPEVDEETEKAKETVERLTEILDSMKMFQRMVGAT